jgi:hypothetical protein
MAAQVIKEITRENIMFLLSNAKKTRKTLGDIYGKLKRGIDGLEYQNAARNERNSNFNYSKRFNPLRG